MREFLQVDDYADGLALFAKHNSKVEHLNFGFGTNIRIDDLARMVMDVVGLEVQLYKDISQYRLRCNLFVSQASVGHEANETLHQISCF